MRTSPRTEFSTLWDNSPANAPLSVPDRPLTGGIRTREDFPAHRILHPLGQFTRQRTSQRPRSPTHWRNQPAAKTLTVRIPPVAGTISTPIGLLQSENLHPLEENTRAPAFKRPETSIHWRNWYVGMLPSIRILPPTGGICPHIHPRIVQILPASGGIRTRTHVP